MEAPDETPCPETERIDRRILGDLPPDERVALRDHVADCPACEERLARSEYLETLLVGAFRQTVARFESPRTEVLARVAGASPSRRHEEVDADRPRHRRLRWTVVLGITNVAALLLLAIAFTAYRTAAAYQERARVSRAETEVRAMASRLHDYAKVHACPPDGIENLVKALSETKPGIDRRWAAFDAEDLLGEVYHDPWGNPYRYEAPEGRAGGKILVYSIGADGEDDGGRGDDIAATVPVSR